MTTYIQDLNPQNLENPMVIQYAQMAQTIHDALAQNRSRKLWLDWDAIPEGGHVAYGFRNEGFSIWSKHGYRLIHLARFDICEETQKLKYVPDQTLVEDEPVEGPQWEVTTAQIKEECLGSFKLLCYEHIVQINKQQSN